MKNLCAGRYALKVRGAIACNLAFNNEQKYLTDVTGRYFYRRAV